MSTNPAPIDTKRAALLVMDYQAGILSRLSNADVVVDKARIALQSARAAGATVAFVRIAFATLEEVNPVIAMHSGAKQALATFNADAPATQIDSRLTPESGEIVVRKTRYGAFSTTDLNEQLQARGVDTLILAGISTSGVTLSTLRDASDRDYRIVVLEDACADRDEVVHQTLMERVFPAHAEVIPVDQLAGLLV